MIVRDVLTEQASKVRFVQDDHMVEHLLPGTSDPAFRGSVLYNGALYDVRVVLAPTALTTPTTFAEKIESRSKMRYFGEVSNKNASRICCTTQAAVGCSVTINWTICRRLCRITNRT